MRSDSLTQASSLLRSCKPVIGMVHLLPLPGSVDYQGGGLPPVRDRALEEAEMLAEAGVDAVLIQNTGDSPYDPGSEEGTIAHMSVIGCALRREIDCPVGVNVLPNGSASALAIAHAIDAAFVRIKVFVGAVVTAEGPQVGLAAQAVAYRHRIGAEGIAIFADIYHRGSVPLVEAPVSLMAGMALRLHADALVIAGDTVEESLTRIQTIKAAIPHSMVFAGGGTTAQNVSRFLRICDGVIVGAGVKVDGNYSATIAPNRLASYMEAVRNARSE